MMLDLSQPGGQNVLLSSLPPAELAHLSPHLEWVDLKMRETLSKTNQPIEHAYFIARGICSVLAVNREGVRIEAGLIGREGFVGSPLVMLVDHSPYEIVVQADGRALRIHREALLAAIKKCPTLNSLLLRFSHTFTVQTVHTALANGRCTIRERLARWLLMCMDRVDADEFATTQDIVAAMLAVRRSGVTEALRDLESKRLVKAMRRRVKIVDRARLEKVAGGAYGCPEAEYARLIKPMRVESNNQAAQC
jgi:CRP-like cAMP-binding protein